MLDQIDQTINNTKLLSLKTYFPLSYNLLNSEHSTLFGKKLIYNIDETNYYKSKIKNLDLDVFIINDSSPNAFTIPGLNDISLLKSNSIDSQIIGLDFLSKHPLSANVTSSGIIKFNSDIENFKVLVFLNSGLFKRIPNIDQRFAILLHELGHWVYIKELISSNIFETILNILRPVFYTSFVSEMFYDTKILTFILGVIKIALVALVNSKNRQNEYDADKFVKDMHYGLQLQHALSLLEYKKDLSKVNIDDKNTFLSNFSDIASMLFFNHTHPPTHKRILSLQESLGFSIIDQLIMTLSPIDKLIKNNNGTLCSFI